MAKPDPGIDSALVGRSDPSMQQMIDAGVPMTQANYLDAYFDGDVPENMNEEQQMALPPQLQGFQGVGLSELPQGPLPIPEGAMGAGTKVPPLQQAQAPPQLVQPQSKVRQPLPDTPQRPLQHFTQQAGWKPQGG